MAIKSAPTKSDLSKIQAMVKDGKEAKAIANVMGIKEKPVAGWVKHFKDGGKITDAPKKKPAEKPVVNK